MVGDPEGRHRMVGGDKGYDVEGFCCRPSDAWRDAAHPPA
jgi:hypothetical protein